MPPGSEFERHAVDTDKHTDSLTDSGSEVAKGMASRAFKEFAKAKMQERDIAY